MTSGITPFTGSVVVLASSMAEARANGYSETNSGARSAMPFALTGVTELAGLVGVVNTLVLSVQERHREPALLRAVGMTRREMRRAVTIEGALFGVVGVLIGLGFGLGAGRIPLRRVDRSMPMVPPWGLLAALAADCLAITVLVSCGVGRGPSRQSPVAALDAVCPGD